MGAARWNNCNRRYLSPGCERDRSTPAGPGYFEFLSGVALLWGRQSLAVMPLEVPILLILVFLGFASRKPHENRLLWMLSSVFLALLAWTVVVSQVNSQPWAQRAFRMLLLFLFAATIAQGRVRWKPLVGGLSFALVIVNVSAFYFHVAPNRYPPYLSGYLGDKNVAGLYYAVFGILGMALYSSRRAKFGHFLCFALLTALTGSRTSMSAMAVGMAWWGLRNRVDCGLRLLFAAVGIAALRIAESRFARVSVFVDRSGTDWFRSMVDQATAEKLATSPWYGSGFNTAWVNVYGTRSIWFHNSYAALRVEGGVPLLLGMLTIIVVMCLGMLSARRAVPARLLCAESALVVVLVCAWKLGEVFFTVPCFMLIGIAMFERYGPAGGVSTSTAEEKRAPDLGSRGRVQFHSAGVEPEMNGRLG